MPHTLLSPAQLQHDLAVRDLTDPDEGPHALQLVLEQIIAALSAAYRCDVRNGRGPRIVPVTDNYDALGYSSDDVT
jgi:phenylalanyl-tRNA synthetase alpha chain